MAATGFPFDVHAVRLAACGFELQAVEPGDAQALAELRVRAMRPSLEAVGRFDAQRARQRLLEGFDAALTRQIRVAGARVGLLVLRPADDGWWLDHLYLEPAAQGAGLGSAVLRFVMEQARAAGQPLRLGALKSSRSNGFYRRHGFVPERDTEWDTYYVLASEQHRS